MSRKPIFEAIKAERDGKAFTQMEVGAVDSLLDALDIPRDDDHRTISDRGLNLIREFEGLRLKAYPDPASGDEPWTIGVGTTVYPSGRKVRPGDVVTEAQAMDYLEHDAESFSRDVNRLTGGVTTQNQHDALVSFAYNLGSESLRTSTLLRKHNEGDYAGAAKEFARWTFASGRRLQGLVRRRAEEAALYRSGS